MGNLKPIAYLPRAVGTTWSLSSSGILLAVLMAGGLLFFLALNSH
jgi:hypothetical protein